MSVELDGRDISDLRVVDLRAELEKRGLDKSGNKQALLDRLQKAIKENKADDKSATDSGIASNGTNEDMEDLNISKNSDVLEIDSSLEVGEDIKKEMVVKIENMAMDTSASLEDSALDTRDDEDMEDSIIDEVKQEKEADTNEVGKVELTLHDEPQEQPEDSLKQANDMDAEADDQKIEEPPQQQQQAEASKSAGINGTTSEDPNEEDKPVVAIQDVKEGSKKDLQDSSKDKDSTKTSTSAICTTATTTAAAPGGTTAAATSSTSPSKIKERLVNDQNRNLWITNISQTTRATELKQALSEHGKVVGAKVVINARHPAACCYGYVRMETVADADNCIAKLNNTELNGQIIRIEKVRPDHLNPNSKTKPEAAKDKPAAKTPVQAPSKSPVKTEENQSSTLKKERKPIEAPKEDRKDKTTSKPDEKKTSTNKENSKDINSRDTGKERSREKDRRTDQNRSKSRDRVRSRSGATSDRSTPRTPLRREVPAVRKEKDILTFDKIKTEREKERLRERERELRMRRREESERVKEIERRQRLEEARLERERQKIKEERERLERERAELLALERERQKHEREKIEQERIELERVKLRMQEEERRAVKRPAPASFRERERSYEDRKRPISDRHFEEAPPPPRFDGPSSIKTRDASPAMKKFSNTSNTSSKDYGKSRINYDKRDAFPPKREAYPPKRDYDDRSHSSTVPRNSSGGVPAVPKYESSSTYPRDRDIRTGGSDPRPRSSNLNVSSSSSKYSTSDNKVRYSERDRERSPHYSRTSIRDDRDRRPVADTNKSDIRSSRDHRYPEPKAVDSVRYDRTSSSSSNWPQHKTFTSTNTSTSSKPWNKDTWRPDSSSSTDRWNSSTSRGAPTMSFSNNPNMNLGPSCPPPPGINSYVSDRFDYKTNMSNMRKY